MKHNAVLSGTGTQSMSGLAKKYRPFPKVEMPMRWWPNEQITHAPCWCSVDLRDGNQALANPMSIEQKLEMFKLLVAIGFKEIEVGFPSANDTEFAFNRRLIEGGYIPDDVTIQVLVQAREDLIKRTVESLIGAKKVIIHLYNSTSPLQRQVVFGKSKEEIIYMAMRGTEWVKQYSAALVAGGTDVVFQYSPESFSATELDFALEVSERVMDVWQPSPDHRMILNLPNTVEYMPPNVHADQIEWTCNKLREAGKRYHVRVSLHTHNDRGTGVAATELGLMAGADRVEGTLFGNGERTGNLDIVTVAMNLFMHGIDPELDFTNMKHIRETYERCTGMTVHPRHPYAGELVFTAFSGSHQDAIKKGLTARDALIQRTSGDGETVVWEVPYLTIDPKDVGGDYRAVIRVNGQSGKAGAAHLLEIGSGFLLPNGMQREFGPIANDEIDKLGREITFSEMLEMFKSEYMEFPEQEAYRLVNFSTGVVQKGEPCTCEAVVTIRGREVKIVGNGNGPVDAFVAAWNEGNTQQIEVVHYAEHSIGEGADVEAIAYVQLCFLDCDATGGESAVCWGAGINKNIAEAAIEAILSAVNRWELKSRKAVAKK
jgi:2-isopropylmalate synthase